MVSNMLELRDPSGGLLAKKVETTLRKMIEGGTNKLIPGNETCI